MEDKPTPLDQDQLAKANLGLAERLFYEGVHLVYDDDGDTLLITIGEGAPAISTPVLDGLYLRIHPETLEVVGCTVVAFSSDFLANNKLLRKLFPNALKILAEHDGVIEWRGLQAQKMLPVFAAAMSR
jgi:hypothetical protein